MSNFIFEKTLFPESKIITNFYIGDNRGKFVKSYEKTIFTNNCIDFSISEVFFSTSQRNVIRGLHFQYNNPQAKLVTAIRGSVWDVIVDLRINSPTYLKWISVELSEKNNKTLLVPKGFAHGFLSLEDNTTLLYQCDGKYDQSNDSGIIYNDNLIGIQWPISKEISIHSERDLKLQSVKQYENKNNFFRY